MADNETTPEQPDHEPHTADAGEFDEGKPTSAFDTVPELDTTTLAVAPADNEHPSRLVQLLDRVGRTRAMIIGATAGLFAIILTLVLITGGDDTPDTVTAGSSVVSTRTPVTTHPGPDPSTAVTEPMPAASVSPAPTIAPGATVDSDGDPEPSAEGGDDPAEPPTSAGPWRVPGTYLGASHDGTMVVTVDYTSSTTTVWSTASHRQLASISEPYYGAVFAADDSFVMLSDVAYIVASSYRVDVIALPSGALSDSLAMPAGSSPPLHSPAADAFVHPGRSIELRTIDGTLVRSIDPGFYSRFSLLSDDGSTLAVTTTDAVVLYDIPSGTIRSTIATRCAEIIRLALSSSGDWLAVHEKCGTTTLRVYDAASAALVGDFTGVNAGWGTLAITRDESRFIIAPNAVAQPTLVIDRTGTPQMALHPPAELLEVVSRLGATGGVQSAVISADERRVGIAYVLYHGDGGYEVSLYSAVFDLSTGQQVGELIANFSITALAPGNANAVGAGALGDELNVALVYEL